MFHFTGKKRTFVNNDSNFRVIANVCHRSFVVGNLMDSTISRELCN